MSQVFGSIIHYLHYSLVNQYFYFHLLLVKSHASSAMFSVSDENKRLKSYSFWLMLRMLFIVEMHI